MRIFRSVDDVADFLVEEKLEQRKRECDASSYHIGEEVREVRDGTAYCYCTHCCSEYERSVN